MSEGRRSLYSDKRNSTDFTNPIAMTIPPQKIESISQLNTLIGQKTLHPLLSIIDLAEATRLDQLSISGDFYALSGTDQHFRHHIPPQGFQRNTIDL